MILKGDDEDKAPAKKPVPKATVPKATAKEVAKEPEPQKTAAERKADLIAAIKGEKRDPPVETKDE